jgi:hypothetical protein
LGKLKTVVKFIVYQQANFDCNKEIIITGHTLALPKGISLRLTKEERLFHCGAN